MAINMKNLRKIMRTDDGVNGVINESINLQIVDGEIATLKLVHQVAKIH